MKKEKSKMNQKNKYVVCYDCFEECDGNDILCKMCKKSFHIICQGISYQDIPALATSRKAYTCNECMEDKLIGSVYDYKRALNRIANCRELGFPYVKAYINQELRFLPECCFQPTEFTLGELRIDHVANRILKKCGIFNVGTAYQVNARENCLFNAVSVLLNGNETLAAELRVRTCIEMTKYR